MLKDSWEEFELGEFVTLQRGYDLPHSARKAGSIPVVTSSGVSDTHSEARVSGPGVVTGRYGTIGEVFFIRENFWPLNTTLFVKDFHGNDPLFVSYLLRTIDFHSHSGKSGVPGVNRNDLHALTVKVPRSTGEQRAIAEALGDVDALIGGLEQLIAKKRDLKQAAMQQLLTGQTRLPGFSGEWEVKSIGELAGGDENIVDGPFGSDLKNSDYTPTGVPVLQGLNITGDRFIWKAIRFISDKKGTALFRSNAQIGDLLTVKIGSVGFSAIIEHLNGHQFAIIPANLLRVRFRNTRSDPRFVYYALTSTRGKRALRDLAANTAQPALSLAGFRRLPVAVPSCVEEQTAITLVLSDVDSEIEALEQRLAKTRALKQGMMQELLTGKTRLV